MEELDKKIAEDGDVFAFRLPGTTETDPPLLMGGEFAAAFSDREEVRAFQAYLTSPEFSNAKAKVTGPGWISANNKLDPSILPSPVDRLSYELITSDKVRSSPSCPCPGPTRSPEPRPCACGMCRYAQRRTYTNTSGAQITRKGFGVHDLYVN